MTRSRALSGREPCQVRKEAALRELLMRRGQAWRSRVRPAADRRMRQPGRSLMRSPGATRSRIDCRRVRALPQVSPAGFDDVVGQAHVVRTLRTPSSRGASGTRTSSPARVARVRHRSRRSSRSRSTAWPRADRHAVQGLRVVPLDPRRDRARRDRARRRLQPRHRRHPRDPRARRVQPGARPAQDLHPRRGPLADRRRLERAAEDARGAARPRRVRALHDRAAQAARHDQGRCQPFAFARPSVQEIRVVLRRIAAAEGIEADEARWLIAHAPRGSFRDAVSQLDQLATACGGAVSAGDARALLGIVEEHVLRGIVDARRGAQRARRPARRRRAGDRRPGPRPARRRLLGHLRLLLLTRELGEVPAAAPRRRVPRRADRAAGR